MGSAIHCRVGEKYKATYVYGQAVTGGLQEHGWAEVDDLVFDGVMQGFWPKEHYYRVNSARAWYRYSRDAVMYMRRRMRRPQENHWRWHHILGLPWAKSAHDPAIEPLLVDKTYCKPLKTARRQGNPP